MATGRINVVSLELAPDDREFLAQLFDTGVLEPIVPSQMDLKEGDVIVCCSDGDQAESIRRHVDEMICTQRRFTRPHEHKLNGGPLLIPENSPLNVDGEEGRVYLRQVRASLVMKAMPGVLNILHFPCGAATSAALTAEEAIRLHMESKCRMKREIVVDGLSLHVKQLVHIDWGNGSKEILAITRAKWEAFLLQRDAHDGPPPVVRDDIRTEQPIVV